MIAAAGFNPCCPNCFSPDFIRRFIDETWHCQDCGLRFDEPVELKLFEPAEHPIFASIPFPAFYSTKDLV